MSDAERNPTDRVPFSLRTEQLLVIRGALRAVDELWGTDFPESFDFPIDRQRGEFVYNALDRLNEAMDEAAAGARISVSMRWVELVAMRDAIETVIDLTESNAGRNFLDDLNVYITEDEASELLRVLAQTPQPAGEFADRVRMTNPMQADQSESFFTDTPPTEIQILNKQVPVDDVGVVDPGAVERTLGGIEREMDARSIDGEYSVDSFFLDFAELIRQVALAAAIESTDERRAVLSTVEDVMPTIVGISNRDDLITADRGGYVSDDLRDATFSARQGNYPRAAEAANEALYALAAGWEDYERDGPHSGPDFYDDVDAPALPAENPSDLPGDLYDVPFENVTDHFLGIEKEISEFMGQWRSRDGDFDAMVEFSFVVEAWVKGVQATVGIRDVNEQENTLSIAADVGEMIVRLLVETDVPDTTDEIQDFQTAIDATITAAIEQDWDQTRNAALETHSQATTFIERFNRERFDGPQ